MANDATLDPPADAPLDAQGAIATLASIRGYREGLTHRAAGILWMVWGITLTAACAVSLAGLGTTTATHPDVPWTIAILAGVLACIACGALLTNAVWKAHALQFGEATRPWVAWLTVLGAVLLVVLLGVALLVLGPLVAPRSGDFGIVLVPLLGAMAAAALGAFLRRRVSPWPAVIVGVLLLALQAALPFLIGHPVDVEQGIQRAILVGCAGILVSFFAVGGFLTRQG